MVRLMQVRCGLFFVLVASATVVQADEEKSKADPSGTWKWEVAFGNFERDYTLRLKLKDDTVTGTIASVSPTGQGEAREPAKISDAKLEANKLSFNVTRQFNDRQFTIGYNGTVTDDKITGSTEVNFDGNPREFDWEAKRVVEMADVLGTHVSAFAAASNPDRAPGIVVAGRRLLDQEAGCQPNR